MRRLFLLAAITMILFQPFKLTMTSSEGGIPVISPFMIDNRATDLAQPSAACDTLGGNYLVVYQGNSNQTIYGAWVSRWGEISGHEVIAEHLTQQLKNPDVTYNSSTGNYLVVWEYYDGSRNRIYGKIIDPDGPDGAEFDLGTPGAIRDRYKPAVAYASTSNKFLAVWESVVWQSGGTSDVEAQIVTGAGALEGSNFLVAVGNNAFVHYEPDLAYNRSRNEYLVAWSTEEKQYTQYDIFARRVTANGVILDATAITIGYHTVKETYPAVAAIPTSPAFGMYAVAWEVHYSGTDHDIYARTVSGLGVVNPIGGYADTGDNETHPAISGSEANDTFLITWTAPHPDPIINVGIHGRLFSLNGEVIGVPALIGGLFGDYSAIATGLAGDFLVVYQDPNLLVPVTYDIWGRFWGNRVMFPHIRK